MFDTQGRKQSLDKLIQGPMQQIWKKALTNELGRLAQGINDIKGNDVVDFISYKDIPQKNCDVRKYGMRY